MDTTRLTCCYFIPIPPFLYCLDSKLALMAFSSPLHGCHSLISLLHIIIRMYNIQNNLTDLCNHVNNKIFHACKSKVMSCGNVTSCEDAMLHGNSTSHLVEIP